MFKESIEKYYPEMVALREDLHRHPEMSYKEFRTSGIIEEKLKEYGFDSVERVWNTGIVGILKGGAGEGKCLGIRADIDALPVTEETGVPYASENPGVMHACGHDLHITIALMTARVLAENRDKFKGTLKFIFQPAEEAANPADPSGGAKPMCEHGVMENPKVDAIIALHVSPDFKNTGRFGLKVGAVTSGFDLYRFDVYGKTGHGSQPHMGNDAILAISQLIVMLQQVVSRNIDPLKSVVLTIGTIGGGSAVNIIPDHAWCGGVFRYFDNDSAEAIKKHTLEIADGIEHISGCKVNVDIKRGYACVENDAEMIELMEEAVKGELGENATFRMDQPATGSEDFSYYMLHSGVPGAFSWLSAEPVGDTVYPLHSAKCCMKPDVIKTGAAGMAATAIAWLNKN